MTESTLNRSDTFFNEFNRLHTLLQVVFLEWEMLCDRLLLDVEKLEKVCQDQEASSLFISLKKHIRCGRDLSLFGSPRQGVFKRNI